MKKQSKTYYSMTRRFIVTNQVGGSEKYGLCELSGKHSDHIVSLNESVKRGDGRGYTDVKTLFIDIDEFVGYINNMKMAIQPEEIKNDG
jgi:hypothetical protein